MKDTDKVELTVGDVKRAAGKCGTAKEVLKEMFPDVFKESLPEWEDITDACSFTADTQDGPFIMCRGKKIGFLENHHNLNYCEGAGYKHDVRDGRIWRRKLA